MAKRKFRCVGIVRKSGKRVSAEITAENEPAARKIAEQNGIVIDSLTVISPVVAELLEPEDPEVMDRIDEIIRADGDELEGYLDDIGDELRPPVEPATKACPFCGERILAVARKCKHCGTLLSNKTPSGKSSSKLIWWIIAGIILVPFLFIILLALLWFMSSATPEAPPMPPIPELSDTFEPQAPAPMPVPTPEAVKPEVTDEEIVYAEKLSEFLDGVEEMASMLEKVPKSEECTKQFNALKARFDALPPPPDAAWAGDTVAWSRGIIDLASMLPYSMTTLEAAMEALNQSSSDSPEMQAACKQAADQIRQLAANIKKTIPPECLTKQR